MYLGIEIGGTKLQLGLGPGDGTMHALWRDTVVPANGADGIRRQIEQAIPQLLAKADRKRADLRGVGIGFGGPVDDTTRSVIKSHQIQGWNDFRIADWIEQIVGLPAVLGNDADVAGLAEALFGAGKGLSPIFYITIGSGIGGGLVINGEIYRGCGRGAAEIGHLRLLAAPDGHDEHLDEYVLEQLASGWAITEYARAMVAANLHATDSPLIQMIGGDVNKLSTQIIGKAIQQGDRLAKTLVHWPIVHLANAIGNVITLLCPRRIILGGGVSLIGETCWFEPLRRLVAERVFEPFANCYDIVPAALGEEVVVHGALALARKRLT